MSKQKQFSERESAVLWMALHNQKDALVERVKRFEGRVADRLEYADMVREAKADIEVIDQLIKGW